MGIEISRLALVDVGLCPSAYPSSELARRPGWSSRADDARPVVAGATSAALEARGRTLVH
jgi:hypothetical protein